MQASASNSSGSKKEKRSSSSKSKPWQAFLDYIRSDADPAADAFGAVRPASEHGRVFNTLNTAGKSSTAGKLNTLGFLLDEDESGEDAARDAFGAPSVPNLRTGKNQAVQPLVREPEAVRRAKETASDWAYGKADAFSTEAAASEARAKAGLGKLGQFAVDAGIAGAQMLGDAALNYVAPGAGLVSMGTRSFGSATQEARAAGASMQEQFNYGVTRAAAELLSEKLFDVGKLFGGGAADDLAEKMVGKLARTDAGRTIMRMLFSGAGEGAEEAVTDLVEPAIRAIYDSGAAAQESYLTPEGRRELAAQAGYDALVGGALGVTGGGVGVLKGVDAQKNAALRQQEAAVRQAEARAAYERTKTENAIRQRYAGALTDANVQALADMAQRGVSDYTLDVAARNMQRQNGAEPDGTQLLKDYVLRHSGESTAVNTEPATETNRGENIPLADADLDAYMRVGTRAHVRNQKSDMVARGESPILTSSEEITNYIRASQNGEIRDTIKGYGKVGNRMAADIAEKSGGTEHVDGYYLELDSNRIAHMNDHVTSDKDVRNIPLSQKQLEKIPEYLDTYDDVLSVMKRKDGSTRIMLGKKINGHAVIIEAISKGRQSLQPVTAYQIPTSNYEARYGKKSSRPSFYSIPPAQTTGTSGYQALQSATDTSITDSAQNRNSNLPQGAVDGTQLLKDYVLRHSADTTAQRTAGEPQYSPAVPSSSARGQGSGTVDGTQLLKDYVLRHSADAPAQRATGEPQYSPAVPSLPAQGRGTGAVDGTQLLIDYVLRHSADVPAQRTAGETSHSPAVPSLPAQERGTGAVDGTQLLIDYVLRHSADVPAQRTAGETSHSPAVLSLPARGQGSGAVDGTQLLKDYVLRHSGESTAVNTDPAKHTAVEPQYSLTAPSSSARGQGSGAVDGTQLLIDYVLRHSGERAAVEPQYSSAAPSLPARGQGSGAVDGTQLLIDYMLRNSTDSSAQRAADLTEAAEAQTDAAAQTQNATGNSLTGAVEDGIVERDHIFTDSSQQQGTADESLNGIDGYINGTRSFDEVLDDYARIYTETVNSNRQWSWDDDIPGAKELMTEQRRMIKKWAVSQGYLPDVRVEKVKGKRYGYADFDSAGVVKETLQLPESMWKRSDRKQFKWLDEQIGGGIEGYTWHHTEFPGIMQLVPYGIHNITNHDGGRSAGMWSEGSRR